MLDWFATKAFIKPNDTLGLRPLWCPFCREVSCHWIKWGSYERYGQGSARVRIQRYRDKITGHTFGILPDALLPYYQASVAMIVAWLVDLEVNGRGTASIAKASGVSRSMVRRVRTRFRRMASQLRLPGVEGALTPAAFLPRLSDIGYDRVRDLFASWKQQEPKVSLLGIYPR